MSDLLNIGGIIVLQDLRKLKTTVVATQTPSWRKICHANRKGYEKNINNVMDQIPRQPWKLSVRLFQKGINEPGFIDLTFV
jgi:hypothetical protein